MVTPLSRDVAAFAGDNTTMLPVVKEVEPEYVMVAITALLPVGALPVKTVIFIPALVPESETVGVPPAPAPAAIVGVAEVPITVGVPNKVVPLKVKLLALVMVLVPFQYETLLALPVPNANVPFVFGNV